MLIHPDFEQARECPEGGDVILTTRCDLKTTLESGQTFAFQTDANAGASSYASYGVADGRPARVTESDGMFRIKCRAEDGPFFRRYFDLDASYAESLFKYTNPENAIRPEYSNGMAFLAACVGAYGDLRILRQPLWETICEFILSANNNIKRIQSLYMRISQNFGEAIEWDGLALHSFPAPARLAAATEAELSGLKLGYRAPYLLETAKRIAEEGLPDLDSLTYEQALKRLTSYKGVGEKVADCVLLFAAGHRTAFPVDVWMERALCDKFGMHGTRRELKAEAIRLFGDDSGIVQQFLFHGIRSGLG